MYYSFLESHLSNIPILPSFPYTFIPLFPLIPLYPYSLTY